MVRKILRLMRKSPRRQQVCSLMPSVDTRGTVNETGKLGERHEISGKSFENGSRCANAVDAELGERENRFDD